MATLAFGFIIEILCQRWVGLTGGSMGLIGVPQLNFGNFANGPIYFFWVSAATLFVVQMLMDYVASSEVGRDLQAMKESESFALTTGMNVRLWRAGTVVVSAFLAGLAGVLFVHQSGYVSSDAFNLERDNVIAEHCDDAVQRPDPAKAAASPAHRLGPGEIGDDAPDCVRQDF